MPFFHPWSRTEEKALARYVSRESTRWLPLEISRYDLRGQPGEARRVVEAIYRALLEKGVRYDLESFHASQALQEIRTPDEVLDSPRVGTCLDLALTFCGLCLANDLLPVLVMLEGHAIAAVSLTVTLREAWRTRAGGGAFNEQLLTDAAILQKLVDNGHYLAVECTGFATSERLGQSGPNGQPETVGREGGFLPFNRAILAGREQLDARSLRFALDVAAAQIDWRIEPYPLMNFTEVYDIARPLLREADIINAYRTRIENSTREFVGRDNIFQWIDANLNQTFAPSGYIALTGEPGSGKTALASELIKRRGYVHHLNIIGEDIRSQAMFLSSVCAQLVARYRLDYRALPAEASKDARFLNSVLRQAADRRGCEPVVVLIDALDEAEEPPAGTNWLGLPAELPSGVVFIVTSRPKGLERLAVTPLCQPKDLIVGNDQNAKDISTYIEQFIATHAAKITERIAAWRFSGDRFAALILEKSEGNFMYVFHVLRDLIGPDASTKPTQDGIVVDLAAHLADPANLPTGLLGYYEQHWNLMKAAAGIRFENYYQNVICQLAAAAVPLRIDVLAERTGLPLPTVKEVLNLWIDFLDPAAWKHGRCAIYHALFREFLDRKVGLGTFERKVLDAINDKVAGRLG